MNVADTAGRIYNPGAFFYNVAARRERLPDIRYIIYQLQNSNFRNFSQITCPDPEFKLIINDYFARKLSTGTYVTPTAPTYTRFSQPNKTKIRGLLIEVTNRALRSFAEIFVTTGK